MAVQYSATEKKPLEKKALSKSLSRPEGKAIVVPQVIKGDTYLVLSDSAREPEDEYKGLYYTTENPNNILLQPPYEPKKLCQLVVHNNILSQCIEAMEVNIDGTGHEFEPSQEGKTIDKAELEKARSFFNEPYPNQSFVKIRREMRRQLEGQGYAFIEVLRNVQGEIVGARNTVSHMLRYVRLGSPVLVTKKINRGGVEVDLQMWERERAFVQRIGADNIFYREFGTTRHINRKTGDWESPESPVPVTDRGTELLVFLVNKDVETPYGIPRWINQLPSVLGSRKAEEQNLEFFDSGGIPPAIIFVQGGTLAKDMSDQLKMYLSGQAKVKNRAVVVEAQSNSGSIDAAGSVQVKVERFGSERANDSMYSKYDKDAEEHVRTGFRLPPLFLGKAADYNFATAQTAYMVAEAQVFQPERTEFDEYITKTLLKGMGITTLKFHSNPITLKDVETQLKAMEMVKDTVETEGFVGEVNKIASLTLEAKEPELLPNGQVASPINQQLYMQELQQQKPEEEAASEEKPVEEEKPIKRAKKMIDLAQRYAGAHGLLVTKFDSSESQKQEVEAELKALSPSEYSVVMGLIAKHTFGSDSSDLVELTHHCGH